MALDNNVASWTSSQLIADVRRKARMPTASLDWTDTVLMREASEQLWTFAGWAQLQGAEGRLLTTFERSVGASIPSPYRAAGEFLLPPLAVGDTVHSCVWFSADGLSEYALRLIDVSQEGEIARAGDTGTPSGYALMSDRVRLYPTPVDAGVLRFTYPRRHPELCADSSATAPAINSAVTVTDAGGGYSRFTLTTAVPFAADQYVDIVNSQYPYRTILADVYVGSVVGFTLDLYLPFSYAGVLPTNGMRLVRAGQLPFVQLPLEYRSCLTWKIVSEVLTQQGDAQAAATADGLANTALGRVLGISNRRSKADRMKIINGHSLARAGIRRVMRENRFR